MKKLFTILAIALSINTFAQTTQLKITSPIVTSLNTGLTANLAILPVGLDALGNRNYTIKFNFYSNIADTMKVLAVFKDNNQIPQSVQITLNEGIEPSTTTTLQSLKAYLESKYNWNITEIN